MPKRKYSFFMPAEDHSFIKKGVVFSRLWLTDMGRILCGIIFVGVMVASPGLHISAYFLPCFIFTLFMTAWIFAFFNKPKVTVKRVLPPSPSAGEYLMYIVIVKNEGKKPLRSLKISEGVLPYGLYDAPDHESYSGFIDWLEPQKSKKIKLIIRCKYRGSYQLPQLLVGTSFPSGLLRFPVRLGEKDVFVVYPRFIRQYEFKIPFKRVYQPGGIAISSNVGDSNEFLNTREYRRGDRLKDIHWASYARTGRLIVKEYVDEYFIRVGVLLDTQMRSLWQRDADIFEARISIAAGIADQIAKKDYIIDLFAAGEILHHFQMGRALAHLGNLLELLSCVEASRDVNFRKLQESLISHLKGLSSMIIILGDWDEDRAQLCRFIEQRAISLRILVVRDKPLTLAASREMIVIRSGEKGGLIK